MKLKQVLEIQEILDGTNRATPIDMAEKWVYYSESRDEWVDVMELDVIHAIRIIRKKIAMRDDDEKTDEKPDVKVLWLD